MVVVLLGLARVDIRSVGRALSRTLDATVLDGDRLRYSAAPSSDEAGWLRAFGRTLREPHPRPHVVVTCTALSPRERRELRMCDRRQMLVILREPSDTAELTQRHDPEHTIVVNAMTDSATDVEEQAARIYARLIPRLEEARTRKMPEAGPQTAAVGGISERETEDVCSGPCG